MEEKRSTLGGGAASEMLSERAAALIEHDILSGVWQPGERLAIHTLSKHYGIGATPLREGLSRLLSRELISTIGQRGFRVANVSEADLEDVTLVRITIESEALRRSIQYGGDEWEAGIVSSLHRLVRAVERDPGSMGTLDFDHLHKAFHRSLLEACGSVRLLRLHDDLYYQAYRYRLSMIGQFTRPEAFIETHRKLADLVLSRDLANAEAELANHLSQRLGLYREGFGR